MFLQEINIVQQQDMFSQKERHDKIQQTATQRGKTVFLKKRLNCKTEEKESMEQQSTLI